MRMTRVTMTATDTTVMSTVPPAVLVPPGTRASKLLHREGQTRAIMWSGTGWAYIFH